MLIRSYVELFLLCTPDVVHEALANVRHGGGNIVLASMESIVLPVVEDSRIVICCICFIIMIIVGLMGAACWRVRWPPVKAYLRRLKGQPVRSSRVAFCCTHAHLTQFSSSYYYFTARNLFVLLHWLDCTSP